MSALSPMLRSARKGLGLFLVLVAFSGTAAAVDTAPELSPGSMAAALTLLCSGIALIHGRSKSE